MPLNLNVGIKSITPYTQRMNELLDQMNNMEKEKELKNLSKVSDVLSNFKNLTNINRTPTQVELMSGIKSVEQPGQQRDILGGILSDVEGVKADRMRLAEYEDMVSQHEQAMEMARKEAQAQKEQKALDRAWRSQLEIDKAKAQMDRIAEQNKGMLDREYLQQAGLSNRLYEELGGKNLSQINQQNFLDEQRKAKEKAEEKLKIAEEKAKQDLAKMKHTWETSESALQRAHELELEKLKNKAKEARPTMIGDRTEWRDIMNVVDKVQGSFGKAYMGFKSLVGVQTDLIRLSKVPITQFREIEMSIRNAITGGRGGTSTGTERAEQYLKSLPGTVSAQIRQFLLGEIVDIRNTAPELFNHLIELLEIQKGVFKEQVRNALIDLHDRGAGIRGRDKIKKEIWENRVRRINEELNKAMRSDIEQARKDYYDPNTPQEIKEKIKKKFGKELGV